MIRMMKFKCVAYDIHDNKAEWEQEVEVEIHGKHAI